MASILQIDPEIAKANPHAVMTRLEPRKASRYMGQRNHDLRLGAVPNYVNQELSPLNDVLMKPPMPRQMTKICKELREQRDMQRGMKSGGNVAYVGIIGFGEKAQVEFLKLSREDQNSAYTDMALAIAKRLNVSLLALTVHRDESGPHAHFVIPAYDLDGMPLTTTMKKGALMDLQTVIAEEIVNYSPLIERGRSRAARKEAGASDEELRHKTVPELHEDLRIKRAMVADMSAQIIEMQTKIDKNEALAEKARVDLEAAKADGADRISKLEKRLATYERRTEAAEQELHNLHQQIVDAEDKADEIIAEAQADAESIRSAAREEVFEAELQAEKIREQARSDGYEKGLIAGRIESIEKNEAEVSTMRLELNKVRAMYETIASRFTKMISVFTSVIKDRNLDRSIRETARAALGDSKSFEGDLDKLRSAIKRAELADYVTGVTGRMQRDQDARILEPYLREKSKNENPSREVDRPDDSQDLNPELTK